MKLKLPHILLLLYIILFTLLAIHPYDREVWIAENLPIVGIVLILVFTYRYYQFSNTSYILMSFLIFLHTIGGHYTFERVPFDFITNLFHFQRNNYDRIAHFTVGFYAYAIAELLQNKKLTNSKFILYTYPILFIFTIAALYEIIEWLFAISSNPTAGASFLGSQGDIWDAQKDMLADGLGSIFSIFLFWIKEKTNKP